MEILHKFGAIVALIGSFALPLTVQAQETGGGAEGVGQTAGPSRPAPGASSSGPSLLGADQRKQFRKFAMRKHRATPYSFREPVAAGTVLPPVGIELYEIPPKFKVPAEYRYAVVNNLVLLVDPVTHQIVEVIE
jgi:hypothetical protein